MIFFIQRSTERDFWGEEEWLIEENIIKTRRDWVVGGEGVGVGRGFYKQEIGDKNSS